jgi:hypothetical protein
MPRSFSWSLLSITRSASTVRARQGAGLLQQLVDQGGLAMVDVGDDGDVAALYSSFTTALPESNCTFSSRLMASVRVFSQPFVIDNYAFCRAWALVEVVGNIVTGRHPTGSHWRQPVRRPGWPGHLSASSVTPSPSVSTGACSTGAAACSSTGACSGSGCGSGSSATAAAGAR